MDPQETKIYTAALIAALVVAIVILYFAVSLIRHQRTTMQLNRKSVLTEITTLEKERSRMAADLHDELGPLLSQIKFRVNSIEVDDEDDQQQLEISSQQIDEVIDRVRGIARNLMPGSLLRKGLRAALEETGTAISENTNLQVTVEYQTNREMNQDWSINIYRTIQEICQNTLKHAQAAKLLIKLYDKKNLLCVLCEDNGKGFDYKATIRDNGGLGLRNIKSRTEIMGGKFNLLSEVGKGTQYLLEIPVKD